MTDETKNNFMLAIRHSLEHAFEADELAEDITLQANIGPVHRAFIPVYDESAQPTQPCVPEPTIKLRAGNDIYFVYLLSEVTARGGGVTGEVVTQHPSEFGQNRPVEASEDWDLYERCQDHFRRLTGAKRLSATIPNPMTGHAEIVGGSNKTFYPGDLYRAYRDIAAYNKAASTVKAGKARGAQRKREVAHGTIPAIELAIESLVEEGKKPTQNAVQERSGYSIATIKRHWKHERIVQARTLKSRL